MSNPELITRYHTLRDKRAKLLSKLVRQHQISSELAIAIRELDQQISAIRRAAECRCAFCA
jgi:hypothetical protein